MNITQTTWNHTVVRSDGPSSSNGLVFALFYLSLDHLKYGIFFCHRWKLRRGAPGS